MEKCMKSNFALLAAFVGVLSLLPMPVDAQDDSAEISAQTPRTAASYDSADTSDSGKGFIEPSSSARPGIYFYKKAVAALRKKQYAFAIEMYEVAASYAYKPAQYNLAVMYAKGEGVPVDLPRAMAWSTLSAERGDKRYLAANKAIKAALNEEQLAQANAVLETMLPKYADEAAMRKAKGRWKDDKLAATGSRLGYVGGLKVGAPGNALGSGQKASAGDSESVSVSSNAWEASGGKQVDGSIAYRQLQETDNPYDPKQRNITGDVVVGDIDTGTDAAKTADGDSTPAKITDGGKH
jgi:TPR repeat protein